MSHFHVISSTEDEQDLLSKIIRLETQIRAQREKERLLRTGQNETYSRIFEPITRELKTIQQVEALPPATPLPASGAPGPSTPVIPIPKTQSPRQALFSTPLKTPKTPSTPDTESSADYRNALRTVKSRNREDGYLGLDSVHKLTVGRAYYVQGNTLVVAPGSGHPYETRITVHNPRTWVMLLAKNPASIIELRNFKTREYYPYVDEYRKIAEELGFVAFVERTGEIAMRNRTKFKLLEDGGFLYSLLPPPPLRVLPSDPQGVLRELQKALAEYRAGNASMRNIIGPLSAQAQRMKILPKNLKKTLSDFNWVYV